jgi:hypothetical protein
LCTPSAMLGFRDSTTALAALVVLTPPLVRVALICTRLHLVLLLMLGSVERVSTRGVTRVRLTRAMVERLITLLCKPACEHSKDRQHILLMVTQIYPKLSKTIWYPSIPKKQNC